MMKSITPMWSRLRHLQRPHMFVVRGHAQSEADTPTFGQRMAEVVAASVGSWLFLGIQAFLLLLWLVYNTLTFTRHFDDFPYILLNLLLSFQAAFTGPVLLIAANVGAIRDHKQADRIEGLSKQNEQLAEQNEQLVNRLFAVEQMLDQHVAKSLQSHTSELQDLGMLMRAVHAAVCAQPSPDGATVASALDTSQTGSSTAHDASPGEKSVSAAVRDSPAPSTRSRSRPRGRGASEGGSGRSK